MKNFSCLITDSKQFSKQLEKCVVKIYKYFSFRVSAANSSALLLKGWKDLIIQKYNIIELGGHNFFRYILYFYYPGPVHFNLHPKNTPCPCMKWGQHLARWPTFEKLGPNRQGNFENCLIHQRKSPNSVKSVLKKKISYPHKISEEKQHHHRSE